MAQTWFSLYERIRPTRLILIKLMPLKVHPSIIIINLLSSPCIRDGYSGLGDIFIPPSKTVKSGPGEVLPALRLNVNAVIHEYF